MERRQFLRALGAGAVVVGFNPIRREWVMASEPDNEGSFDRVPKLDGTLVFDDASLDADSIDMGNIIRRRPAAVLRPGSVADIAAMIRYCRPRNIKVSCRGQAHTTHGQSLSPGLVIESATLNKIHSIGPTTADVGAGVLWRDLITAAYERGFSVPVMTGYTKLSVGGTLSVGGVGGIAGSTKYGCQIDEVVALEVVTGTGDVRQCSLTQNRDLFEAALGGLGQCGIITRATMNLVPARQRARTYAFHYVDNAAYFRDQRLLLGRSGLDEIYTQWFPPGTTKAYQLNATVFYDPTYPPDDLALTAGTSVVPVVQDTPYLDYMFFVDNLVDAMRAADWDRLVKPWFDVWLSDSQVERYVGEVMPTLTQEDVGPAGFCLIFPTKRSRITRPFYRVPPADGNGWVYLFDILTASLTPTPRAGFAEDMRARNNALYKKARTVGGVRYAIGSMDFSHDDWIAHYGEVWGELKKRKQRFDPANILSPGPGIFPG